MVTITKSIRDSLHDGLVTIKVNKHFPQHCHVKCKYINTETKRCNLQVKPVKLSEYLIRYECALFERLEEIEIYKAVLIKHGENPEELLDP